MESVQRLLAEYRGLGFWCTRNRHPTHPALLGNGGETQKDSMFPAQGRIRKSVQLSELIMAGQEQHGTTQKDSINW